MIHAAQGRRAGVNSIGLSSALFDTLIVGAGAERKAESAAGDCRVDLQRVEVARRAVHGLAQRLVAACGAGEDVEDVGYKPLMVSSDPLLVVRQVEDRVCAKEAGVDASGGVGVGLNIYDSKVSSRRTCKDVVLMMKTRVLLLKTRERAP